MTAATLAYKVAPYRKAFIGKGSYSIVFRAIEASSGAIVALKKSRASKSLKRPTLRHESRVLQLLQGQASIPVLYGYGHLEHFEYIALEIMGLSVAQMKQAGSSVKLETIIQIVDQMLSALKHVHSLGIVHRDIKPENLLCSRDLSRITLIDFGISTLFNLGRPGRRYNPLGEHKHIVGTIYWASLNSHNGEDLTPRDDIESLAYVALFLLHGTLPWMPRPHGESTLRSQEVVRLLKTDYDPSRYDVPQAFYKLLAHGRSLLFHQLPDYAAIEQFFRTLAEQKGYMLQGPLDWKPCDAIVRPVNLKEPDCSLPIDHKDDVWCEGIDYGIPTNSYFAMDIELWQPQGDRDKDVTFSSGSMGVTLDGCVPCIVEVIEDRHMT